MSTMKPFSKRGKLIVNFSKSTAKFQSKSWKAIWSKTKILSMSFLRSSKQSSKLSLSFSTQSESS